jgi:hypothetical protein
LPYISFGPPMSVIDNRVFAAAALGRASSGA